jgi:hypothetical protein
MPERLGQSETRPCGFKHGDPLPDEDEQPLVYEHVIEADLICMKPSHKRIEAAAREVVEYGGDCLGRDEAIERLKEALDG